MAAPVGAAPRSGDPVAASARRIAAWTAAIAVVLGVALAITVPRIDSAKDNRAARVSATEAAQDAAQRAEIVRAQRASFGASAASGGVAQLADARRDVLADARARHAAGEFDREVRAVGCQPARGASRSDLNRFSCVAQTEALADLAAGPQRNLGYPFSLVIEPSTGRYAVVPDDPGARRRLTGHSGDRIPQPPACTGGATPAP